MQSAREKEAAIARLKNNALTLIKEKQYNVAKRTLTLANIAKPEDKEIINLLESVDSKKLTVSDELRIAYKNAQSGKKSKMIRAFKTFYAYQDQPYMDENPCIFLFMANMLEIYPGWLNLKLKEEDKAYVVSQYVNLACRSRCRDVRNFIDSLNPNYRRYFQIDCFN